MAGEAVLAQTLPKVLGGVRLRAVHREGHQTHVQRDGQVVRVVTGDPPGDDPRALALRSLRDALLAPDEANPVSECLQCEAAS